MYSIDMVMTLAVRIIALDLEIAGRLKAEDVPTWLITIPGIGPLNATATVAIAADRNIPQRAPLRRLASVIYGRPGEAKLFWFFDAVVGCCHLSGLSMRRGCAAGNARTDSYQTSCSQAH